MRISLFVLVVVWLPLAGCHMITPVQSWEKGTLAKSTMRASGPVSTVGSTANHVYTSKEAVKGGTGVGGGGCGCN